jgi:hypothetical protein
VPPSLVPESNTFKPSPVSVALNVNSLNATLPSSSASLTVAITLTIPFAPAYIFVATISKLSGYCET